MPYRRRQFVKATVAGSMIGLAGCSSNDDGDGTSYPESPIDVVIPFDAGGGTDSVYRLFQPYWDEELPTNTVVDNRSGGAGRVGQQHWLGQGPDGYTLFSSSGRTHWALYPEYYDVAGSPDNIAAIGRVGITPNSIITRPDAPWDDLQGLQEYTQDNEFNMAGLGFATDNHYGLLTFIDDVGLTMDNVNDVSLSDGQSISQAVANGDIDAGSAAFSGVTGLAESGDVTIEAVLTDAENLGGGDIPYPTVNTIESFDLTASGLAIENYAHAELDDARLEVLREAHAAAMEQEEYREEARSNYIVPGSMNGEETQEWIESDALDAVDRYSELVDQLGLETS